VEGHGDGPTGKVVNGPKPRDFVREEWKHGETPEKALDVVSQGVKETAMPGWKGTYSEAELRAVTAYVYYLAGKPIPRSLRSSAVPPSQP
jgi:cytochrome c oxidase cbb3-type subunit 3